MDFQILLGAGQELLHGLLRDRRLALGDGVEHRLVARQEHRVGLRRDAIADEQADADQVAHLQEKIIVAGGQDAAMKGEICFDGGVGQRIGGPHGGVRIRGGTARSYYVGIETSGLAIPGAPRPLRALCVVPHGMEEGTKVDVPSGEIGLVVGEPATFRFFSSPVRKQDQPGDLLASWADDELAETDSLEAVLPADDTLDDAFVPVRFQSHITELGIFELWCASTMSPHRWKLEFSVRRDAD